jgi:alanine-synthesizing transaminase
VPDDARAALRFARRTAWPERPHPLAARLEAARADGALLCDLTTSNPTAIALALPDDLDRAVDALLAAPFVRGDARRYAPDPRGLIDARRAVADAYARRGLAVDPDDVLLTASTSESYAHLLRLFAEPGDEVLVPTPGYPLFDLLVTLGDAIPRPYRAAWDGAWHLPGDALPTVEDAARVALFVSVSPNNPTGHALVGDDRAQVERWLRARRVPWVSDEVFADFAPRPPRETSALGAAPDLDRVALGGLSKSALAPQLKLGWMVLAGPNRDAIRAKLEVVLDTFLSVSTPIMLAAPELLVIADTLQSALRARLEANRARLDALTTGRPLWPRPYLGGWSTLVDLPRTASDDAWAHAALDAGVVVQPGWYFDLEAPATVVLSLLPPPDVFEDGVRRLVDVVERAL